MARARAAASYLPFLFEIDPRQTKERPAENIVRIQSDAALGEVKGNLEASKDEAEDMARQGENEGIVRLQLHGLADQRSASGIVLSL